MRISVLIKFEPPMLEDLDRIAKRLGKTRTATLVHLLDLGMIAHDRELKPSPDLLPSTAKKSSPSHTATLQNQKPLRTRPDEATLKAMKPWERKHFGWD